MCRACGCRWEEALSMVGAAFVPHAAAPKEAGGGRGAVPRGRSVTFVFVLGNEVRAVESGTAPYGLRGLTPDGLEVCPAAVYASLSAALGSGLGDAHDAFCELARRVGTKDLTARRGTLAYEVFERFMAPPVLGFHGAARGRSGTISLNAVYGIADEYAALPWEMPPEDCVFEDWEGQAVEPPWEGEWDPGEEEVG